MRLFVGIALSPALTDAAARLIDELRHRVVRLAPESRLTWVAPERLHITVRFIGEVDDAKAAAIASALQPPLAIAPFDLAFAGGGAGVRSFGKVIAYLPAPSGPVLEVERDVTARLGDRGIPPESRPYRPHVTLARVRDTVGLRIGALLEGVSETALGIERVEAITLYESRLSPKGPTYIPRQRTALTGPV